MKLFYAIFLLSASLLSAQTTTDFEELILPASGFLNGSGGITSFSSGNLNLPVDYNANYDSWTGWAISSVVDTFSEGFTNQYAARPGSGFAGSLNYAVAYAPFPTTMRLTNGAPGNPVNGLYVTNGTYPYYSMLNGDGFAKRFGGELGDDPDFFLLTIRGMIEGAETFARVDFYLADYRFANNSLDYIIDDWTYIDLTSLGRVDSLIFSLSSSDNNNFGMLTPSYFCVDNVTTSDGTVAVIDRVLRDEVMLYPNPVTDQLNVKLPKGVNMLDATVIDISGREILHGTVASELQVGLLASGTYYLRLVTERGVVVKSFIR